MPQTAKAYSASLYDAIELAARAHQRILGLVEGLVHSGKQSVTTAHSCPDLVDARTLCGYNDPAKKKLAITTTPSRNKKRFDMITQPNYCTITRWLCIGFYRGSEYTSSMLDPDLLVPIQERLNTARIIVVAISGEATAEQVACWPPLSPYRLKKRLKMSCW